MIPDRRIEFSDENGRADGPWTPDSSFNLTDKHGNPLPSPDVYVNWHNDGYTGYSRQRDVGMRLVLRGGTGDQVNPSFYYSWEMPGDIGGNFYRDNIEQCNTSVITYDPNNPYYMTQEPGDMQGPTVQGINYLIAEDPSAYWDPNCKCVKGSKFSGQSPRLFPIPLFNPQYYASGQLTGRTASFELANFLGFYADYVDNSGGIHGIITNITGVVDPNAGPAPSDLFPKVIRLVQ
jgi:hypothetical protein